MEEKTNWIEIEKVFGTLFKFEFLKCVIWSKTKLWSKYVWVAWLQLFGQFKHLCLKVAVCSSTQKQSWLYLSQIYDKYKVCLW